MKRWPLSFETTLLLGCLLAAFLFIALGAGVWA
jgi:hypothetical protein